MTDMTTNNYKTKLDIIETEEWIENSNAEIQHVKQTLITLEADQTRHWERLIMLRLELVGFERGDKIMVTESFRNHVLKVNRYVADISTILEIRSYDPKGETFTVSELGKAPSTVGHIPSDLVDQMRKAYLAAKGN